jgi:hypothetical protein
MNQDTIAAYSSLVVAITGLLTAIKVLLDLRKNTAATKDTNHLVNSRMDTMVEKQEDSNRFQHTLIQHLESAGMPVPPNPAEARGGKTNG